MGTSRLTFRPQTKRLSKGDWGPTPLGVIGVHFYGASRTGYTNFPRQGHTHADDSGHEDYRRPTQHDQAAPAEKQNHDFHQKDLVCVFAAEDARLIASVFGPGVSGGPACDTSSRVIVSNTNSNAAAAPG